MMKRTKEEAALTRISVLDAAKTIISQKGYNRTTLEEIAKVAGVTRGAIYWHFNNKLEIFEAIINEYYDSSRARIDAILNAGHDPLETFRRVMKELFNIISNDSQYHIIEEINFFKYDKPKGLHFLYSHHLDKVAEMKQIIKDLVLKGVEAGQFNKNRDPDITVIAMLGYVAGIKSAFISGLVDISVAENADKLTDFFIHGMT
jgi:TetR/AcrR family transcriptional regulator, acrAB operon repressor